MFGEEQRMHSWNIPVPQHRHLHQLVLRLRRPQGLQRRLRRGVLPQQVPRRGLQVQRRRPVRVARQPLRRRQGLPGRRGRGRLPGHQEERMSGQHLPVRRRQVPARVRVLQRHRRLQRRQRRAGAHLQGPRQEAALGVLSAEVRQRQVQVQRHRLFGQGRLRRRHG